jgi:hypothetical protein
MTNLPQTTEAILAEMDQLKAAISGIGIILRGSVTERYMPCGRKGCRCQATPAPGRSRESPHPRSRKADQA